MRDGRLRREARRDVLHRAQRAELRDGCRVCVAQRDAVGLVQVQRELYCTKKKKKKGGGGGNENNGSMVGLIRWGLGGIRTIMVRVLVRKKREDSARVSS